MYMHVINNCIALELLPPAEKADNSLGFAVDLNFFVEDGDNALGNLCFDC